MRPLGLRLALACAFFFSVTSAFVRPAHADVGEDQARAATEQHDRGVRAFAAGRYRQAIELFRRADALNPSAAIAFNVASAYERLGERAQAAAAYREYLKRAPDAPDAREVERRIRALKTAPQKLIIQSEPAGASLWIDGKSVGATPSTVELDEGLHTLELQLAGHSPEVRVVEVAAGMSAPIVIGLQASAEASAQPLPSATPSPPLPRADALLAERVPTSAPAHTQPRTARDRTSTVGVLGWVAMGGAVAAFGGALTLEIMRRSEEDRARRAQTQIGFHERVETMQAQQTGALVLAATGAGLTALGGVLLYVDASSEEREEREERGLAAGLLLQPRAIGAQLTGRY